MSAEVSCITFLWHFEFVSPIAMHDGSSDLNTSSLRSGDKARTQSGCCQKPRKQVTLNSGVCVWVWERNCTLSLDGATSLLCAYIHASRSAPGCVYLCKRCVCQEGGASWLFNYSSAKTLHVHSRASQPHGSWYIIERIFLKKRHKEAEFTHSMGSSTDQLFKY